MLCVSILNSWRFYTSRPYKIYKWKKKVSIYQYWNTFEPLFFQETSENFSKTQPFLYTADILTNWKSDILRFWGLFLTILVSNYRVGFYVSWTITIDVRGDLATKVDLFGARTCNLLISSQVRNHSTLALLFEIFGSPHILIHCFWRKKDSEGLFIEERYKNSEYTIQNQRSSKVLENYC